MREVVFDTETTGLDPADGHRVVEIGGVELLRGAVTGRSFHVYVNPERDMPAEAQRVHGISAEFLADKPRFEDASVADAFVAFIGDAKLVAHNAEFDMRFVNAELARIGKPQLANPVVDTMRLARRMFPGAPVNLDALCTRFGIDTKERERHGHGALLDSRLLAEVYVELTGGAQGGLALGRGDAGYAEAGARPAPPRPAPLPSLVTAEEAAAHAAFIAELGDAALWRTVERTEAA